ncbi:MAG: methyltransferase domain-containing protein [Cyclobacteriaceae bacterium]
MTCKHCCGADMLFDLASAEKEMKSFEKRGPGKITKRLLRKMGFVEGEGKSVLDVGGGVGAAQWHFLRKGAIQTTDVDASSGYLKVAKHYAVANGFKNQASFIMADLIDVKDQLESHDITVLDKVICCYPDYKELLGVATEKTKEVLALSFPLAGPVGRAVARVGALYMKWKKNPFRAYSHPPQEVHDFIESKGFELREKGWQFPFLVRVYVRSTPL